MIADAAAGDNASDSDDVMLNASTTTPQGEKAKPYFSYGKRLSVAVITPYRAQCRQLKLVLGELDFREPSTGASVGNPN